MTHWFFSIVMLAALAAGLGQLDSDQIRQHDRDQLKDGSCETCPCTSSVAIDTTQFNA